MSYKDRLPQLRVNKRILKALEERAAAQRITLAEAHRQALAAGLFQEGEEVPVIRIVGTIDAKNGTIVWNDGVDRLRVA